jgi:beta-glucanase (GH16 family)
MQTLHRLAISGFLILTQFIVVHAQVICSGRKAMLIEEPKCPAGKYTLYYEDEFNGTTLDTSKWTVKNGVVRDPEQKQSQQWFSPENVSVGDGILRLAAKRDTFLNHCFDLWINPTEGVKRFCNDFFYTASEIAHKTDFGHGIYEISCKLPKGKGLGMAFWLWSYPQNSEIDIFEINTERDMWGRFDDKKLARIHSMNSHNDYYNNGWHYMCPTSYTGPDFSADFHTFTVKWTPHKIEWYVDGELKRTSALFHSITGQMVDCGDLKLFGEYIINKAFPVHPMHMIISLGITAGDLEPDSDQAFPAVFEIDYVRYYKPD